MKRLMIFLIVSMSLYVPLISVIHSEKSVRKADEQERLDKEKQKEKEYKENLDKAHQVAEDILLKLQKAKTDQARREVLNSIVDLMENPRGLEARNLQAIKDQVEEDHGLRVELTKYLLTSHPMSFDTFKNWITFLKGIASSDDFIKNTFIRKNLNRLANSEHQADKDTCVLATVYSLEVFPEERSSLLERIDPLIPDLSEEAVSKLLNALPNVAKEKLAGIDLALFTNIRLSIVQYVVEKMSTANLALLPQQAHSFLLQAVKDIYSAGFKQADDITYALLAKVEKTLRSIQNEAQKKNLMGLQSGLVNEITPWNFSFQKWELIRRFFPATPDFKYEPAFLKSKDEKLFGEKNLKSFSIFAQKLSYFPTSVDSLKSIHNELVERAQSYFSNIKVDFKELLTYEPYVQDLVLDFWGTDKTSAKKVNEVVAFALQDAANAKKLSPKFFEKVLQNINYVDWIDAKKTNNMTDAQFDAFDEHFKKWLKHNSVKAPNISKIAQWLSVMKDIELAPRKAKLAQNFKSFLRFSESRQENLGSGDSRDLFNWAIDELTKIAAGKKALTAQEYQDQYKKFIEQKPISEAYAILGLEPTATKEEVGKARRKLALQWSADKHPEDRKGAEEKMKQINAAYETVLRNLGLRQDLPFEDEH